MNESVRARLELRVRETLEKLGQKVVSDLDEIRRMACPRCHLANLSIDADHKAITIQCETPTICNEETNEIETCTFYAIVTGVSLTQLPDLSKTYDKDAPAAISPKAPAKRRKAATRKRSR